MTKSALPSREALHTLGEALATIDEPSSVVITWTATAMKARYQSELPGVPPRGFECGRGGCQAA
jgi:hypothetical protein